MSAPVFATLLQRAERSRMHWAAWAPVAWTAVSIFLWVLVAATFNTGQFADNVEQFVWAQSYQTGYWKHPPLPTWMLRAAIQAFGFWTGWTYVLAASCFAGTAFFTWRIAQRLAGDRVAAMAVLLLGLHLGFSQRAQLYNHNTVLVLFSAMTVWAVMRALESTRRRDWVLGGVCAGLALLAKYQAVLLLSGILIALGLNGALKDGRTVRGCLYAALAGGIVISTHLAGLLSDNAGSIGYAASQFRDMPFGTAAGGVLAHFANQVRFHFPVLVAIGLTALLGRLAPDESAPIVAPARDLEQPRAWLIGLVAWPIIFMTVVPLVSGLKLQAQWGLSAFQFVVLYIATMLGRAMPNLKMSSLFKAVLVVQVFSFLVFLSATLAATPHGSRLDRSYPARELAQSVLDDWRRATSCPLKFVVGPSFEAGLVSMYAGGYPQVLEAGELRKSPWIDLGAMQHDGFATLQYGKGPSSSVGSIKLPPSAEIRSGRLSLVITPPEVECERPQQTNE